MTKKNLPSQTFCIKPWIELAVSPTGTLTPCCIFERPIFKDNETVTTIWNSDLQEVWNGQHWKEIRKKMLSGEKVHGCEQCYQQEAIGNKSNRIESNYWFGSFSKKALENTSQDGEVSLPPQLLDLKLTNKCNLACRMCQPKDSDFVNKQFEKIQETEKDFIYFTNAYPMDPFLNKKFSAISSWTENKYFLNTMEKLYPSLKQIALAGGEPLLIEKFYEILEEVIQRGNSQTTKIVLTTNLSILPKRFINLISQFKNALIYVSIDGFEKSMEYIRYPIKWEKINKNIERLAHLAGESNHLRIAFASTLQALNILEFPSILKYYDQLSSMIKNPSNISFKLQHVTFPEHLRLIALPQDVLKKAIQYLEDLKLQLNGPQKDFILAEIDRIICFARDAISHFSPELFQQFIAYNKSLDQIRGHCMTSYLPELAELICYSELSGKFPEPSNKQLRNLAYESLKQGQSEKALKHFLDLTKENPQDFDLLLDIGDIYYQSDQHLDAFDYYCQAYDCQPDNLEIEKRLIQIATKI